MYPACEVIGRYVLPIFRSLVAKELVEKYNFTQVEAAKKLGTSQAAISQYIHSKRGYKGIEQFERILPILRTTASEIAKSIATGTMNTDQVMLNFCKLCSSLRQEGNILK